MVLSRKWLIVALLALCVGVQMLEASGHWDRTFRDANDEAGVVVVVLCIGIAIALRKFFLRVRPSHSLVTAIVSSATAVDLRRARPVLAACDSPPISLRI
jgi:heme A synthase